MSRVNITPDGYLEIDTESNYIYEVPVNILIHDKEFINNLVQKNWFNKDLLFEIINKLKPIDLYKNFCFDNIIFEASENIFFKEICINDDLYSRITWIREFNELSNTF